MLQHTFAFALLAGMAGFAVAGVPSTVPMPSDGLGWYHSPGSPGHTASGGIGNADDTNALDLNLGGDADNGLPVYAIADGYVVNSNGWGGSSYGQLLLKHFNPDGSSYYCGYLHMRNVTSLKSVSNAYIRANTQIGTISNINATTPSMANHLHLACYEWNGTKYVSKPINFSTLSTRQEKGLSGSVLINGQVVNRSPFSVLKNAQFSMNFKVTATRGTGNHGKYFVMMSSDFDGANPVGKVGEHSFCASYPEGSVLNAVVAKPSFSSPTGQYFLQIYHSDSCSGNNHVMQRVSGAPIAITLQ